MSYMMTEAEEQKCLVQWMNIKHIMHFSVINENNHSKLNRTFAIRNEAKAKAMGKVPGVSDVVVFLQNKILFIELKRKKKVLKNGHLSITHTKISDAQYKFMTNVNKYEYAESTICYGWEDAREFISLWQEK